MDRRVLDEEYLGPVSSFQRLAYSELSEVFEVSCVLPEGLKEALPAEVIDPALCGGDHTAEPRKCFERVSCRVHFPF